MWLLTQWVRAISKAQTAASARPAARRLILEQLEDRQVPSASPLSISATVNANFQPAVFSISTTDHTLWEYNLDVNPGGSNHWLQISTEAFTAVSAVPADYSAGTGNPLSREPAAYAIRESDHSLWEYNPEFNPTSASQVNHWLEVSPGAFESISAAVAGDPGNAGSGFARTMRPVVYGVVEADHSLWENDAEINPGAGSANDQWIKVSPGEFTSISATDRRSAYTLSTDAGLKTSERFDPVVYGVVATDHSLWENDAASNPTDAEANDHWTKISPAAFTAISAAHHTAPEFTLAQFHLTMDEPMVYGVLEADHSLWKNDVDLNPTDPQANNHWMQISTGYFTSISATASVSVYPYPTLSYDTAVVGVLVDGSVWENNPAYDQAAAAPDRWKEIAAAHINGVSATNPGFSTGATFVFGESATDGAVHDYTDSIGILGQAWGQLPDYHAAV